MPHVPLEKLHVQSWKKEVITSCYFINKFSYINASGTIRLRIVSTFQIRIQLLKYGHIYTMKIVSTLDFKIVTPNLQRYSSCAFLTFYRVTRSKNLRMLNVKSVRDNL